MTRLRRSFTAEFKLEAASLVLDQGYSVPEASRSLDVGETVLRRWVQQLQSERTGTTPIGKALTPEQQKIQELEARINRLEREKDILKKATVDSIGQRNNHVKTCSCGGLLNETNIYSKGKSVCF